MTDGIDGVMQSGIPVTDWRVVFCDPEPLDPAVSGWRERAFDRALRLLKPGFRHCFLMRRTKAEWGAPAGWLIVNPNSARLDIFEVADPGADAGGYGAYIDRLVRAGRVRVLDVPQFYPATLAPRPWFSCVEVVKHATGLKPPLWVVTPWQLYRWLMRGGAAAARN